jgi:hypothetical protein
MLVLFQVFHRFSRFIDAPKKASGTCKQQKATLSFLSTSSDLMIAYIRKGIPPEFHARKQLSTKKSISPDRVVRGVLKRFETLIA